MRKCDDSAHAASLVLLLALAANGAATETTAFVPRPDMRSIPMLVRPVTGTEFLVWYLVDDRAFGCRHRFPSGVHCLACGTTGDGRSCGVLLENESRLHFTVLESCSGQSVWQVGLPRAGSSELGEHAIVVCEGSFWWCSFHREAGKGRIAIVEISPADSDGNGYVLGGESIIFSGDLGLWRRMALLVNGGRSGTASCPSVVLQGPDKAAMWTLERTEWQRTDVDGELLAHDHLFSYWTVGDLVGATRSTLVVRDGLRVAAEINLGDGLVGGSELTSMVLRPPVLIGVTPRMGASDANQLGLRSFKGTVLLLLEAYYRRGTRPDSVLLEGCLEVDAGYINRMSVSRKCTLRTLGDPRLRGSPVGAMQMPPPKRRVLVEVPTMDCAPGVRGKELRDMTWDARGMVDMAVLDPVGDAVIDE